MLITWPIAVRVGPPDAWVQPPLCRQVVTEGNRCCLLDEFFTAAVAALKQAKNSDGSLGADVHADANNVRWTLTAWQDRGPMQALSAVSRI